MRFGTSARIAAGLAVVAVVVAVNQISAPKPRVLGTKITACRVDGTLVSTGPSRVVAEPLTVTVLHGKPAAALVPPVKVTPNATPPTEATQAATISLGAAKTAGKGRARLTVRVANLSDCPIAFDGVTVTARRTSSAVESTVAIFGNDSRVLVRAGRSVKSTVELDVARDGSWAFNASATTDVGAAS